MTSSHYSLNVCIFCYKNDSLITECGSTTLDKFCKHLRIFVDDRIKNNKILESSTLSQNGISCCVDCQGLISGFCDVYHQIKCFELQLLWKLDSLKNVINSAEKVPSRTKFIKQCFSNFENESIATNSENEATNSKITAGHKILKELILMRKQIIEYCRKGRNLSQPRVLLQKLDHQNHQANHDNFKVEQLTITIPTVIGNFSNVIEDNDCDDHMSLDEHVDDVDEEVDSVSKIDNSVDLKFDASRPNSVETKVEIIDTTKKSSIRKLSSSIKRRHLGQRKKSRKHHGNIGFRCGLCGNKHVTYQALREHKNSFIHRFLEKKNHRNIKTDPNNINLHDVAYSFQSGDDDDSDSSSSHDDEETIHVHQIAGDHYNLRANRRRSNAYQGNLENDQEKELAQDKEYSQDSDSSSSTSLSEDLIKSKKTSDSTTKGNEIDKQFIQCDICKRKLLERINVAEKHFKSHHDTSSLRNVDTLVKKCDLDGCTAYFLKTEQLRIHKELQHSVENESDESIILSDTEMEALKCALCSKSFSSLRYLLHHKRKFHKGHSSTNKPTSNWKRKICPELKCTKSFVTKTGFDAHKKLHGKFPCQFCDEIIDYAPNLAYHEYEVHTLKQEESQKRVKIKCPRCIKCFQNRITYTTHFVNTHLGISTIVAVCPICQFQSHRESLRDHHLSSHFIGNMNPSEISRCSQCPAYFKTKLQLSYHKIKVHPQLIAKTLKQCAHCKKRLRNDRQLERHLDEMHPGHDGYQKKCEKCDRIFRNQTGLSAHKRHMHSSTKRQEVVAPYSCLLDGCNRRFETKYAMDRHLKLHESGNGNYSCMFCDEVYENVLKLSMHEVTKHPGLTSPEGQRGTLYCSRCPFKHKSTGRFQIHFAVTHTGTVKPLNDLDGRFECEVCQKELTSGRELALHEAQHNPTTRKEISCPRCPKSFTQQRYVGHFLREHLKDGRKRKSTICPICNDVVFRKDMHFNKFHNIKDLEDPNKIYRCEREDDGCKAYFITGLQLIRHQRKMHHNDWNCKECGKKLKYGKTLYNHIARMHPNLNENLENPFPCELENCKKRFETKAELEWHQKYKRHVSIDKNSGVPENPVLSKVKCDKCGKEYKSKSGVVNHNYLEHSGRTFICPECGKVFKSKQLLDKHLDFHKGPETWKFQCSTCGKKCHDKYRLTDHMKVHTKEKPYICQFCGDKYAHQHNWRNHMLKKHENEDNLPKTQYTEMGNRLSRKGTKKGDCIIAGIKQ